MNVLTCFVTQKEQMNTFSHNKNQIKTTTDNAIAALKKKDKIVKRKCTPTSISQNRAAAYFQYA